MAEEKNVKCCRQEYAELLCDFMFQRLFGSEANKDVLIGFLNMILEDGLSTPLFVFICQIGTMR